VLILDQDSALNGNDIEMKTREFILQEIQRTASENGGVPLGARQLERTTSIRPHEWGRYWARIGDAQREAGFSANSPKAKIPDDELLRQLALLTRLLKHRPNIGEVRVQKNIDPNFPGSDAILRRFGSFEGISEALNRFCQEHSDFSDVLQYLPKNARPGTQDEQPGPAGANEDLKAGYVYLGLLKIGREKRYKVGQTNLVERRNDQLSIQLPERLELVHVISTDDAVGIEAYWKRRFKRNTNGEWFILSQEEIRAFKKRKFM